MNRFARVFTAAAAAVLLSAGVASAQQKKAAPTPAPAAVPKVTFEKYELSNGIDVILHVDRKLPIVHVNQWYHVGSKNEKAGRTGFAHLFEHVMFQGSANAVGEYFTFVERAGANLREGGVNGTTSFDRTNYFATVPSGNLEYLLWVESDRLATLGDALTQEKLDGQREVVRNERRQSLENVPYGRAWKLMFENLHPSNHPYSWMIIGSHEDLQAATLDDVKDFFRTYYTPNNLTLVIAGDFDVDQAKSLVEKYFGTIPPGQPLDRPSRYVPTVESEKVITISDRVPQARTYFAWPTAGYWSDEDAVLEIASYILSNGISSRLQKALVYDKQLATDAVATSFAGEISGMFGVWATARPGSDMKEIEASIEREIARLAKEGPTQAELDRAKTKWEYGFVTGLEAIGGWGGKADLLAQYNTFTGEPGRFDADVARHRAVTAKDIRDVLSRRIDTKNRVTLRFQPETAGRPAQIALDRATPPSLGEDRPFETPTVVEETLSNGMKLYVVERQDLPKVAVRVASRAGAIADPAGKAGLAQLTARNMPMGTKGRTAEQISDQMGDLGATISGGAAREISVGGFEVLKRNLEPALTLFADVIRNPTFPAAEFDREKKRTLDQIAQASNNPGAIATRVRPMLLFGADHPYGRPVVGLPGSVEGITRDDVAAFHSTYWKPGSSSIYIVGDVTVAEAKALAEKTFGAWSGGAAPTITIPPFKTADASKVYLVDRQNASQTIVSQSLRGPIRGADGYDAFRLADSVWGGGGFGTRLNLNLREDKGYSYGVFSNLSQFSGATMWVASGGVQTDKTKESVVEFVKELGDLAGTRPITAEELEAARDGRIRGYSQQFESLGRIADQITELWANRLPLSELQREITAAGQISRDQVLAASTTWARPKEAVLLLVGDREKIEPGIRELNLGEIVILDAEGKPVTK
ncbi:MAG TPA: pitrilysin family protein [Thermoanaerobaculia bacterium]